MKYQTLLEARLNQKTMARHRIVRKTMGKDAIKKSRTVIANMGPSSNPLAFTVLTTLENRSADGSTQDIRVTQDTESIANVGDIIKYCNFFIQCGARDVTPEDESNGWLEWAIVKYKEGFVQPPITNLGTQTLGDVCTKMFRGDCLLTGALPIGGDQPNVQPITIKIPKIFCKIQIGSKLTMFAHFRSVEATNMMTDTVRTILSANYKLYV